MCPARLHVLEWGASCQTGDGSTPTVCGSVSRGTSPTEEKKKMKGDNPNRLSGGLLQLLKHSRVAWYNDPFGATTAYYEQPAPGIPDGVFVNGRKLTDLVADREGRYADFPSPGVQQLLRERGVTLESGWECQRETYGLEINDAVVQSHCRVVKHHNGQVSAQYIGDCAIILVGGT